MRTRLVIGLLNYNAFLPDGEWNRIVDVAAAAERAGVDGISVADHVVLSDQLAEYPYGSFPGGPDGPWLEPLTTLAAIAGRTSKIRLITGILIAPLRPAGLLAKAAATLDQLSRGRLELGVGTGWLSAEYDALGLDFGERGRLLDSTLAACRELWRPGPTDFHSDHVSLSGVHCEPRPVQEGGVPFWIGGKPYGRNVDRIARGGYGWLPPPGSRRDEIVAGTRRLRSAFAAVGRDPGSLQVRVSVAPMRNADGRVDPSSTFRHLPALLEDTGATDVLVSHSAFAGRFDGHEEALYGQLVEEFSDALRGEDPS